MILKKNLIFENDFESFLNDVVQIINYHDPSAMHQFS
jgi:hypothetical protein